jgi:ADP-ribose pyrophosphatase YjhB (NUDIX family)
MQAVNCKLIADVAVFSDNEVLLVKYKDSNKYDHQKGWFLPDDLLKEFEHPDDTAKRILNEQIGLSGADVKLENIESFKGNDKSWHLVFHYKSEITAKDAVAASDEIEKSEWFDLNNLPDKKDVAHHGWALYTIDEIKKKT